MIEAIEQTLETRRGTRPEVHPDTRIESLDLNSLDLAEVFVCIQETVGFELDPDSVGDVERVRDLVVLRPLAS